MKWSSKALRRFWSRLFSSLLGYTNQDRIWLIVDSVDRAITDGDKGPWRVMVPADWADLLNKPYVSKDTRTLWERIRQIDRVHEVWCDANLPEGKVVLQDLKTLFPKTYGV